MVRYCKQALAQAWGQALAGVGVGAGTEPPILHVDVRSDTGEAIPVACCLSQQLVVEGCWTAATQLAVAAHLFWHSTVDPVVTVKGLPTTSAADPYGVMSVFGNVSHDAFAGAH
jgi:hypothetical protein